MEEICHTQYIRNDDPIQFYEEVNKAIEVIQSRGFVVDPINVSVTNAFNEHGDLKIFQATFLVGRRAHE